MEALPPCLNLLQLAVSTLCNRLQGQRLNELWPGQQESGRGRCSPMPAAARAAPLLPCLVCILGSVMLCDTLPASAAAVASGCAWR